jgi:hypothetical protein
MSSDSRQRVGVYYHGYRCAFDKFGGRRKGFGIDTKPGADKQGMEAFKISEDL